MQRFEGKVIAMAGGSGGIGSATSHRLAQEGALVYVGDVSLASAEQTAADIIAKGGRAVPHAVNIGDEDSVAAFIAAAASEMGGIDGCYVNGYDASRVPEDIDLTTMDMDAYDHMMHVNLRGQFLCTRYAVPQILRRGGGAMLYTSSGAAYLALPDKVVYAMVKNGIHGLSRNVASRWGRQGIRSNVIAPGMIVHPASAAAMGEAGLAAALAMTKAPRLGRPEDIAAMAALLLSDDGEYVTGQVICVDGGGTMRA